MGWASSVRLVDIYIYILFIYIYIWSTTDLDFPDAGFSDTPATSDHKRSFGGYKESVHELEQQQRLSTGYDRF